jgi:hypothetical protein
MRFDSRARRRLARISVPRSRYALASGFATWCCLGTLALSATACGSREDESTPRGAAGAGAGGSGAAGGTGEPDAGTPDAAPPDDAGSDRGSTAWPPPEAATTLPLEVLGAPGAGLEASIMVSAADLDAARSQGGAQLLLTVHNVVAAESAEVAINGGPPVDLGAASGPFLRSFDGQVASGRIAIDPALLQPGNNRFVFRYTRQVVDRAAVSGFRVLAVALELAGKKLALALPAEDPTAWQPLDASPAAIERGRSYFQDVSRDLGPTCARCHADSGADLQYYGFSTKSLVERALFHRFTRAEAQDLSSYVRSLSVTPQGRPYDGPFQPGPSNRAAAGAGYAAMLPADSSFAESAFGAEGLPAALAWNWPETVDPFRLPTRVGAPTWMRWLPRELEDDWFTRKGGILATTERALAATPSLEAAQAFMSAALTVGKDVLLLEGDYEGKVDVLRFAAVKLWDWSRKNGFERPDHGMPDGSPAYPYEVGFAFFEAAQAEALPGAAQQTMDWWWVQLASNPGRGVSTGRRPLNFEDVLLAAENAGLGPAHLAFLHLFGSWEESRGALAERWGTADSPVRLLKVPMRALPARDRVPVLRRFLEREAEHLAAGGTLAPEHHQKLAEAWTTGCAELSATERADLRATAPDAVRPDLSACP